MVGVAKSLSLLDSVGAAPGVQAVCEPEPINEAMVNYVLDLLQPGQGVSVVDPGAAPLGEPLDAPPDDVPCSLPNLNPVLAAVETPSAFFLFYPYEEYTLRDMIIFSPGRLFSRHTVPLFIVYQLLQVSKNK